MPKELGKLLSVPTGKAKKARSGPVTYLLSCGHLLESRTPLRRGSDAYCIMGCDAPVVSGVWGEY